MNPRRLMIGNNHVSLKVENDRLKKISTVPLEMRRSMIEPEPEISVALQCELLDVARSSFYHESEGETTLIG